MQRQEDILDSGTTMNVIKAGKEKNAKLVLVNLMEVEKESLVLYGIMQWDHGSFHEAEDIELVEFTVPSVSLSNPQMPMLRSTEMR